MAYMAKIVIHAAQKEDLQGIAKLFRSNYDEIKSNPNLGLTLRLKKPSRAAENSWALMTYKSILSGDLLYDVAEQERKIIGVCFVIKYDIPDSEMSHIGTLGIKVGEKFRKTGIGTKLMKHMLSRCKNKFEIIELSTFSNNNEAKKLYEKLGFKRWGIAPRYVKRGKRYIDKEYMYLRLK